MTRKIILRAVAVSALFLSACGRDLGTPWHPYPHTSATYTGVFVLPSGRCVECIGTSGGTFSGRTSQCFEIEECPE